MQRSATMSAELRDIGNRLRAFRLGRGIGSEDLASRIGISRAALYRAEKGQIPKVETLSSIAQVLGVSLATLLGAGVEYVDTAPAWFERMRQLEESSHQIVMLFGPVSYLLTSDGYDRSLRQALLESVEDGAGGSEGRRRIDLVLDILARRKAAFRRRRPTLVSLIASSEFERFLHHGLIGRLNLPPEAQAERRRMALAEARHIRGLLLEQPMGIEIGIVQETVPGTSFQIFRQNERSILAISPFRLGEQPNVHLGVALITSAPEPLLLHERIANDLWQRALKGREAAGLVSKLIARYQGRA